MEAKWSRLRDLREDHDLSQADVAAYLNCTQVSYSYYEVGQKGGSGGKCFNAPSRFLRDQR